MEYERTEDGQIQAAFARRVGKVLLQYESGAGQLGRADQHEATLCICLLQAVLTQCTEAIKRSGGPLCAALKNVLHVKLTDQPPRFGFDEACIDAWGHSSGPPTYRDLMTVVRDALSHPTVQADAGYPTTGYTTVMNDTGLIQNFRFVGSPWVTSSENQKGFAQKARAAAMERAQSLLEADQKSKLGWRERTPDSYVLELEGQPFVPHTIVTLSVLQLRTLTLELTDLLGADYGLQATGVNGREARQAKALSESTINQGAPVGRS